MIADACEDCADGNAAFSEEPLAQKPCIPNPPTTGKCASYPDRARSLFGTLSSYGNYSRALREHVFFELEDEEEDQENGTTQGRKENLATFVPPFIDEETRDDLAYCRQTI
ncbi:hypothetical protein HYFRA_00012221 [Hymenoscyphus fraxineus]|uniref:Uncharacterized protein n=1 Tax=Hymenoscyphus fraxineus TaxID=746836 RepID=A0A9N9PWJ8_9HELO|nr:hypothetical protein HYFRA_00012221 [Hymenoscyphus fraxineus]